jgi:hypothetical protein
MESPRRHGRILVVSINVQEQTLADSGDRADMWELQDHLGFRKNIDVFLLQQTNASSARWLAQRLSKRSRRRFVVAIGPGRLKGADSENPVVRATRDGKLKIRDDSAVIVNTTMLKILDTGKFSVTQKRRDARGTPLRQLIPWVKVRERGNSPQNLKVTAASIHLPKQVVFKSRRVALASKAHWSRRIARLLKDEMPDNRTGDNRITVLGGDFNTTRCINPQKGDEECRVNLFWRRFRKTGFRDGFGPDMSPRVIDYIFTQANISGVYRNSSFRYEKFSDHGIVQALIEDEDETGPWVPWDASWMPMPVTRHPCIHFYWRKFAGWDAGTGLHHWDFYRRPYRQSDEWEYVGSSRKKYFIDQSVAFTRDTEFEYIIKAVDRAGNSSDSEELFVTNRYDGFASDECPKDE